jgi:hypothetical protein
MDLSNTCQKLHDRYRSYTARRPKTILLTNEEFFAIHQPPVTNARPTRQPQTVKRCRATKLDGQRCDAVVKIDGDFCRRHVNKK